MSNDPRHHLGNSGEDLASAHLMRLGYRILERNYRTRWGELDIVAYASRTLCFCEVKTRRVGTGGAEPPVAAINPAKQRRVRRMAASWLCSRADRPWAEELRFDAIGVTFDRAGSLVSLEHLEGVF